MPAHHPSEALLLDYAAGDLREPTGLVVATHLALCPECRRHVRLLEAVGGALLETLPVEDLPAEASARDAAALLAHAAASDGGAAGPPPRFDAETCRLVPEPLRSHLGVNLKDIAWRKVARGLDTHELAPAANGFRTRLLRIGPGAAIPRHGHGGSESVLVLGGGFSDEHGHYARGDLALSDAETVHRPVADPDGDCLCLIVVEGGVRFAGALGRLLNLFARY
ncbi:MAG TPA: ChrR family anti-sigma-E factor [Candidatus Sulfotelmatobacter sp.]|nr:ChrR family anti-sigma-E factor [Candidatus Sulfotelmatobacter sp.]